MVGALIRMGACGMLCSCLTRGVPFKDRGIVLLSVYAAFSTLWVLCVYLVWRASAVGLVSSFGKCWQWMTWPGAFVVSCSGELSLFLHLQPTRLPSSYSDVLWNHKSCRPWLPFLLWFSGIASLHCLTRVLLKTVSIWKGGRLWVIPLIERASFTLKRNFTPKKKFGTRERKLKNGKFVAQASLWTSCTR